MLLLVESVAVLRAVLAQNCSSSIAAERRVFVLLDFALDESKRLEEGRIAVFTYQSRQARSWSVSFMFRLSNRNWALEQLVHLEPRERS